MLVIFKSKAGGDIIMFEENAKQILDLLNKDTDKGIITAEQTADAIVKLENEIERRKMIEAQEKAERERIEKEEREKKEKEEEEEGKDPKDDRKKEVTRPEPPVSFSARTYPFMQLLKAANKKKKDIYWGVQT
ncbi:DUF1840 domain-containing protein [Oxalobacter formigenes]|mgnify:CR=1 FL=1|uniref:DUF1840 domain-containing protein n=1 Tax=Oxalobacter formigenes OXCC13 TaxID=556269 RepID=C3XBU7_OXAFO|nr:DUF1840 domain-containing protein [Oxalobacter formigenes]ARQ45158.1 hypothetical protein BRW83_0391 [Oxalobacter formigenes]ARQ77465.1 hypothetical protein BRW84_01615 [Oxalobacter formigenes OXCC13]EEO30673.1 hypothetical protein OFBG_01701 [Oxalobacter formigenes OXCC13]MCZ4062354.1 DUF1840 domain-containing protein [Oxalobacter formigenes]QDX34000.1 DUF1840 domain-containing protein [Oxalobacter formigenes]